MVPRRPSELCFNVTPSLNASRATQTRRKDIHHQNKHGYGKLNMAAPAEPLLASSLWTYNDASKPNESSSSATRHTKVATGCKPIDNMLSGGFHHGTISCLSADADCGAREVSQALIVSHLLSREDSSVVVIDTALSFDIRRLHRDLVNRTQYGSDANEKALKALDRLKIMKVFDFVGLTESLTELQDDTRDGSKNYAAVKQPLALRGTVGDSEDEDADDMLDTSSPQPPATARSISKSTPQHLPPKPGLLIIDDILQPISPLLKNNYAQGQALLSSLMRSLGHLTKAHNLCTILLNGVLPKPSAKEEPPSAFASCTLQPVLGKVFGYMLDIHLLVHKMRRRNGSAEVCSVIEVLQDRHDGRVGKWAPFEVNEDGGLVAVT